MPSPIKQLLGCVPILSYSRAKSAPIFALSSKTFYKYNKTYVIILHTRENFSKNQILQYNCYNLLKINYFCSGFAKFDARAIHIVDIY
jgi:hypothetical protein